jgi:heat shock protein HtpX
MGSPYHPCMHNAEGGSLCFMSQVNGLYGHIQRNLTISRWIIAGFFAASCVCWVMVFLSYNLVARGIGGEGLHTNLMGGSGIGLLVGMPSHNQPAPSFGELFLIGFVASVKTIYLPLTGVSLWLAYFWVKHEALLTWMTGARRVSRFEESRLYNLVENLSITVGQPMPAIEIVESGAMNAYAAGLTPNKSVIGVTRGLLDGLSDAELQAVLAHEYTHILNGDSRVMLVASVFVGIFENLFNHFKSGITGAHEKTQKDWITNLPGRIMFGVLLFAPLCASFAACWIPSLMGRAYLSRSREFLADAGAVEMTRDANALVSALIKVTGYEVKLDLPASLQAMMIANPTPGLFATHPPVEQRIAALSRFAGAHIPIPRRTDGRLARPKATAQQPTFGRRTGARSAPING